MEHVLERSNSGFIERYIEMEVPLIELSFRYGDVTINAGDPRDRFFVSSGGGVRSISRHDKLETAARRVLESFGAVELACVEHLEPAIDSRASYLLSVSGDEHDHCSFGAYALPQLRTLGWEVEVAADYPYQAITAEAPWYAAIDESSADWFGLELGVLSGGKRISLLPAFIELLERCPDDTSLRALLDRPLRFFALPTGDGRFVSVPAERLQRVLSVLRELYDDSSGRYPTIRCGALTRLDDVVEQWHGGSQIRRRARQLSHVVSEPPEQVPCALRATLRSYQRTGVAWLQHLRTLGVGGVLADDMGLGKTLQTIAHLLIEKCAQRSDVPSLVVAPTSLMAPWQREIARFAPLLRTVLYHGSKRRAQIPQFARSDIIITSYPLLARDRQLFEQRRFHVLVLDEAQTIKNRRSQAHRAVAALDAAHTVALTGTPIENHLDELYSLMAILVPELLGHHESFRSRFRKPIEAGDSDQLDALRQRVAPFMLRRVKDEVAPELPPKTEIVRPVELRDDQRELYETIRVAAHADVRKLIRAKGLAAATVPVLDALMKLRQVCCDPRLVKVASARRAQRSAKLELLLRMLRQGVSEGRRTLVFSQFTSMLALISEALLAEGIRHVKLTGNTRDRQKQIDVFQRGKADVFLISLKAGGTGLTLTEADTVIHYDPWWNPAVQAQATDRAHRIGQTKPVFVYNLIAAGSVEERMLQLQQQKRQLADAILGAGLTRVFDDRQVEDLFAPLA